MRSDWVHEVWVKLSFGSVIHTDIDTQVEALTLSKSFIFTNNCVQVFLLMSAEKVLTQKFCKSQNKCICT